MTNAYSDLSFWFDSLGDVPEPDLVDLPAEAEVVIVGGGFTGMWTAYYLKQKAPELDITVLEAETIGFGASGRNGGWCMGEAAGLDQYRRKADRREAGLRLHREMFNTVDEVGRISQAENIDCHYAKGGWLNAATLPHHVDELKAWVSGHHEQGFSEDDYRWLEPEQAAERLCIGREFGAAYASNCAVIHPARLVRGLADVLRSRGVRIVERTPATEIAAGQVTTPRGIVRARHVLRATEGYTASLKGHKRTLLPLYSMVVATEPLPESVWQQIGLRQREVFDDPRRVVIYGQRTHDNRMVLGGRAGYYFGSQRRRSIPDTDPNVTYVAELLRQLFPMLDDYRITHGWGGLMGVPTTWRPCVSYDRNSGMGWAGGYVGEGVAATNLAGRVLSDLVLERDTDLTQLPWVDDLPRRWVPEPLRYIGTKTLRWMSYQADAAEVRRGKPAQPWHYLTG